GICSPVSVKTRVIPTFCAITPERIIVLPVLYARTKRGLNSKTLELDLDVDACGQIELHQGVDGLRGRIDNVEKTLVSAHLELLTALLIDMWRTVDGELLDAGRQRNRSADLGAGAFRRVHDLTRRRIEDPMVERLKTYANVLAVHCRMLSSVTREEWNSEQIALLAIPCFAIRPYSRIEATTPAPTVRPP